MEYMVEMTLKVWFIGAIPVRGGVVRPGVAKPGPAWDGVVRYGKARLIVAMRSLKD